MTAFANTDGGKILFGVSNNADIQGIEKEDLDEIELFLTNICEEKTNPRVLVKKDFIKLDNKLIGIFTVEKSAKITQNRYDGGYYIRRGSTNRPMRPEEIESHFIA